jgi:hypothetical protein
MIDFIKDNWFPLLSIVVTPIIITIINKKTITFSSADDVIKLKEYRQNKKIERRRNRFYLNLYRICFQKQRKYKGWSLWDFQEFGDIKNRWFRVKNEEGEYLTIGFPENIIVRRYGYDPNDRLSHGNYCYKPNFIENIFIMLKQKHDKKLMEQTLPCIITLLENKKQKKEQIELNEIFSHYKNINICLIEEMLNDIRINKQRKDLTDLITIRQLGTNHVMPYFSDNKTNYNNFYGI